ncbi:hypothetical protein ID866_812 [Astraeus odoratus]|nr:hypothetical protein ID866_812 [Astraeus odoratus]
MASMDTDEQSVVLPSSTTSGEIAFTIRSIIVLGALLGTQNGREVEIVNTFELATEAGNSDMVDHGFLVQRRDQYKQVFPSLEFIGWYTVASTVTSRHIALHEQFTGYCSTPLLLVLQCSADSSSSDITGQALPFKAYEPSVEIRDKKTRSVFIEVPFKVETGEAERIAVDWTARGGGGSTSCQAHKDHTTLRSLTALIASLPASENNGFREEFDTEYEDVQLTAFLSVLTKSTNILNDLVDRHLVMSGGTRDDRALMAGPRRRLGRQGGMPGDWSMHS